MAARTTSRRAVVLGCLLSGLDSTRCGWMPGRSISARRLCAVRLDAGALDIVEELSRVQARGRALKLIKQQLAAVADHGLGYGLLRYLDGATGSELAALSVPQLGFNYLGRFAGAGSGGDWAAASEGVALGGGGDPDMPLAHAIEVNALTVEGPQGARLQASWAGAAGLLSDAD